LGRFGRALAMMIQVDSGARAQVLAMRFVDASHAVFEV
jgi:hypothetical protein